MCNFLNSITLLCVSMQGSKLKVRIFQFHTQSSFDEKVRTKAKQLRTGGKIRETFRAERSPNMPADDSE